MRKFLKALAIGATAVALMATPALVSAQAQSIFGVQVQPFKATPVGGATIAADTAPALVIKYKGTDALAKVAIESDGNLTFTVGGSAYDGFECPVSGDLGGVIDVSDGDCDTLGEVVDAINSDVNGDFIAVIAAGLRSDSSDDSFLADAADTDVLTPAGEVVYWDSSTLDDSEIVLVSQGLTQAQYGLQAFGSGGGHAENVRLPRNPYNGTDTVLLFAQENITNAGTVGNFNAYCVVEDYKTSGGSEVATNMYQEAGAATTVTGTINEFLNSGGLVCRDGKVVVRIYAASADSSAIFVQGYGYKFQRQ